MTQAWDDERTDAEHMAAYYRQVEVHARNSVDLARETVERSQRLIERSKALLGTCRARYP